MKQWILAALASAILLFACKKSKGPAEPPVNPPPEPLAKGVNLSNWFNDYSDPSQFSNRFSTAALQLIKSSGFTYVRLPVGSTILFDPSAPSQLKANNLAAVDAAVNRCIAAGLAVTINIHPWQHDIDSLLANEPTFADKLADYWKAMAGFFRKYPADKLYFELFNEPHASAAGLTQQGFGWWRPVQEKLARAIRQVTTDHFVIAGGEGWNSINGLLQLTPYDLPNIIYNFHFYEPFLFTHQGATWTGWAAAMAARNVPYPSDPASVASLAAGTNDTDLKNTLYWYGDQRYNTDSLDKWIKRAYDWGQAHNVKVIANEFGSYKTFAPRQSRLRWIRDTRTVFEKYKIGWAMWECDEGFGWIDYVGGNRNSPAADNEVLSALGLKK